MQATTRCLAALVMEAKVSEGPPPWANFGGAF